MQAMYLFPILLLFTYCILSQSSENCTEDECDLDCNDRGYCCIGEADFSLEPTQADGSPYDFHITTQEDSKYCNCADQWTGVACQHSQVFCDEGQSACYHGGVCVKGTVSTTNKRVHVCDCRTAIGDDGVKFIGLHCETPVPQVPIEETTDVTVDNPYEIPDGGMVCNADGSFFCLNNGECQGSMEYEIEILSCSCPYGYAGIHCELDQSVITQPCDLDCMNGGVCVLGIRNSTSVEMEYDESSDPNDIENYQHCQCPTGFSGLSCEIPYTTCSDEVHCFHGGTCVSPTEENGMQDFSCDCSNAKDESSSYSGPSCQLPSTEFCNGAFNLDGNHFCVNNGTCVDSGDGIYKCTCIEGYSGDHCEYGQNITMPPQAIECLTECENGGICAEGGKDFDIEDIDGIDHLINETYNNYFEHCTCPNNFTGVYCEIAIQICGSQDHYCFHGSVCIPAENGWSCDCTGTNPATIGQYCEHFATSICDENVNGAPLCANNGTCQPPDGVCACPEGFRGDHCEIVEEINDEEFKVVEVLPDDYQAKSNNNVIESLAIVSTIAILVIIIAVYITNKNQVELDTAKFTSDPGEHEVARHPNVRDAPQPSLSEGMNLNLEDNVSHQDSLPATLNDDEIDPKNKREII